MLATRTTLTADARVPKKKTKKNPSDVLATVWDLAKSGRKGDPPGLTKPEFERAACLVSFGIHESKDSLLTAVQKKSTSREAKRLRYAKAGMFWKFEAFDVRPVESMPDGKLVARDDEPTKSLSVVSDAKRREREAVRAVAKPLVAPISLRVPTTGRRKRSQSDAMTNRDRGASSSSDEEDASGKKLPSSHDGSHSHTAEAHWEARFPEEDSFSEKKSQGEKTPNGEGSVADPFADLVAALSAAPSTPPNKIVASTSSLSHPAEAKAEAEPKRTPHLLDEVPGVDVDVDVDVSFDRMRLEEAPEEKNAFPADKSASVSASDPGFAFETLRGPEAFAFDFSGHAFETGAAETGAVADEAVDEDEEDLAPKRMRNRADDDVLGGVARGSPEETNEPFSFDDGFAREKSFFEDDGDDGALFSPRSPRRPARDPEMEEWSAACRTWPWLAGEARAEERRDEEETEAEAGWAAF